MIAERVGAAGGRFAIVHAGGRRRTAMGGEQDSDSIGTRVPAAGGEARGGWHGRLSLRAKGIISLAVVVCYVGIMGAVLSSERLRLLAMVTDLEQVHRKEEQMVQANLLLARAVLSANESFFTAEPTGATRQLFFEISPLSSVLASLSREHAALGPPFERLQALLRELAHRPSRDSFADLRMALQGMTVELDRITRDLRSRKESLMGGYHETHDRITLETLFFLFLGVVVVGAAITIFFTRLTWDIRRVGARAVAIVKGYRGRPLEVTRGDEVGGMMVAINQMQEELRNREKQLEISRQQQFHQEKMAAVGSIAAAVAHEINNPIMAIEGAARAMVSAREDGECSACQCCQPEMVLEQTRRIAQITRQISEFSVPQANTPEWIDVNSIVANTCAFVRFDRRFRTIDLQIALDPALPAIIGIADHITQVLINLLVNAADALEDSRESRVVRATTALRGDQVEIAVADNGPGMSDAVKARAFEEFFTTKPRGKGSGLGLFLCKTLVEQDGGAITVESTPGIGTTILVKYPVPEEGA
jgi:two-component system NtrC family sensor kinase